jgi:serine/threonine protein kinase
MLGDLNDLLEIYPLELPSLLLPLMRMMLLGLNTIHRQGLAHNDIKLENILYDLSELGGATTINGRTIPIPIVKYVDFGLTCSGEENPDLLNNVRRCGLQGSPVYASPDYLLLEPDEFPSLELAQKDDIWALGIVFRILAVNNFPFEALNEIMSREGATSEDIFNAIGNSLYTLPVDYRLGTERQNAIINDIISLMSAIDAEDRPSTGELLELLETL